MKLLRVHIPLLSVKIICIIAVLAGVFFFAAGNWVCATCFFLGAYVFERNRYRCPGCNLKLDMKHPLFRSSVCPACRRPLRP